MSNKQLIISLMLIFTTASAYSEPDDENKVNDKSREPASEQKQEVKPKPPANSKTYNYEPSEKIQADSAVAFPVDI